MKLATPFFLAVYALAVNAAPTSDEPPKSYIESADALNRLQVRACGTHLAKCMLGTCCSGLHCSMRHGFVCHYRKWGN
ncbi:hypothetical protein LX36DRAFT_316875 [Colletotrichum falcatum]|nr:hypothetical protein LX36DRAFT_316875 [Colletotrichum falcatum]